MTLERLNEFKRAIISAGEPAKLLQIEGELDAFERHLKASGLLNEIAPVRELRMRARWRLGQLLANVERGTGPGRGKKTESGLTSFLKQLRLTKPTALAAQRLATLPESDLERAFALARRKSKLGSRRAIECRMVNGRRRYAGSSSRVPASVM